MVPCTSARQGSTLGCYGCDTIADVVTVERYREAELMHAR